MATVHCSPSILSFGWLLTVLLFAWNSLISGLFATEDYVFDFERVGSDDSPWTSLIYQNAAKERMCFYEKMMKDVEMDVAYRVIYAGNRREINFQVIDPNDNLIVNDNRLESNRHKFTPTVTGDFKLCLDNSFSPWSGKTVYFEYASTRVIEKVLQEDNDDLPSKEEPPSELDQQIELLLAKGTSLREQLRQASRHQAQFRHTEYKDRKVAEKNFDLVNGTSLFNCVAILLTGLIQVGVVRFFFSGSHAQMKATGLKLGL